MLIPLVRVWILISLLVWLTGCGEQAADGAPAPSTTQVAEELGWDSLIPVDWRPETLMAQVQVDDVDAIGDEDPRAGALMEKLRQLWADAPVVTELDGRLVRLPGFVVPLEMDASQVSEFLLVPYYGACIHVPPPPANQTVYVVMPKDKEYRGGLFDTVWVTGILRVTPTSSELASAGYRIDAARIEPYVGDVAEVDAAAQR